MRPAALLLAAGLLVGLTCSGCSQALNVSNPRLTSGAHLSQGNRGAASSFNLDDRVVMLVDVTWNDPTQDGGWHDCAWRWYRGDRLVSSTPSRRLYFRRTPFTLRTARLASPLGPGHFAVETLVDDKVVARSAFDITG